MRIFRFEKWFVDVLTTGRDYIIVFHTLTEVLGIKLCFIEVNIGWFEEGSRDLSGFHLNQKLSLRRRENHTISTREGDILLEAGIGKIKLSLRGIELELALNPVHRSGFDLPGMRIPETGRNSICWKPLFLKTLVSGKLLRKGDEQQVMGNGYVDYLTSTLSPFKVPVRQLYWGRLHSQDCDLTWSYVLDKNEKPIVSQMVLQLAGKRVVLENMKIHPDEWKMYDPPGISCPSSYSIESSDKVCQVSLNIRHASPAIISVFAENPGELGSLRLALLKRISGNPRGIKFFSAASLDIKYDGKTMNMDDLLIIDEYVKFK